VLDSNSIAQTEGHNFSDLALLAFTSIPLTDDFVRIGTKASNPRANQDGMLFTSETLEVEI
jgi:hypothetical protein